MSLILKDLVISSFVILPCTYFIIIIMAVQRLDAQTKKIKALAGRQTVTNSSID